MTPDLDRASSSAALTGPPGLPDMTPSTVGRGRTGSAGTRGLGATSPAVPECRDHSGVAVTAAQLLVSGVAADQLRDALEGRRPLGFPSVAAWQEFQTDLRQTLIAAGITDATVRVGGSSRTYWRSRYTRPFPQSEQDLVERVRNAWEGAEDLEARSARAVALYRAMGFSGEAPRPQVWGWDWKYLFGLETAPSDYDIEVASDIVEAAMQAAAARTAAGPNALREGTHQQWRQAPLIKEFPALAALKDRWQTRLGRAVDIECFPRTDVTLARFAFRTDWWRIEGMD